MSNQVDVDPALTIIAQGNSPYPPTLLKIAQVGKYVKVVASPPALTTAYIVTELALYRSDTEVGPWAQVDRRQISDISIQNNLFDLDPVFGSSMFYACTALDFNFNESAKTDALAYASSNL